MMGWGRGRVKRQGAMLPSGETEFQVAASLGLDLQVSRTVTLRMAQVEYRSFMGGYRSDRFTVSSGAVFRFGRRQP
jgi:hypothetical protein